MSYDESLSKSVKEALKKVMDPELGANLVDLGMIRNVKVENGVADIDMMLTSWFCPLANYLVAAVKSTAEHVEGIKQANVKVVGYGLPPETKG